LVGFSAVWAFLESAGLVVEKEAAPLVLLRTLVLDAWVVGTVGVANNNARVIGLVPMR
jgi:hypothetical protein